MKTNLKKLICHDAISKMYDNSNISVNKDNFQCNQCFVKITTFLFQGSDGSSPVRHEIVVWTNADILSIAPLGPNECEISY